VKPLDDVRRNWDQFARTDPLWAIVALPDKRGNRWDWDDFMAVGVTEIDTLMAMLAPFGRPVQRRSALDFGCGVGRLSQALAGHFDNVTGVDISEAMVKLARKHNRHGRRCTYVHNPRDNLRVLGNRTFDLIYSNVTLQHVPPPLIAGYISEFVRLLDRDGVLAFQLPSEPSQPSQPSQPSEPTEPTEPAQPTELTEPTQPVASRRPLRSLASEPLRRLFRGLHRSDGTLDHEPVMLMGSMPPDAVIATVQASGAEILDVLPDGSAGPDWISHLYVVGRRITTSVPLA
jgi:SAM-dependent methyltransferase